MLPLRVWRRYFKGKILKNWSPRPPNYFAFYIAYELNSWNKNEKKKKLKDPYKKFRGEKSRFAVLELLYTRK
jgi:hypothetical protein